MKVFCELKPQATVQIGDVEVGVSFVFATHPREPHLKMERPTHKPQNDLVAVVNLITGLYTFLPPQTEVLPESLGVFYVTNLK